jgi:hypothetical protein
MRVGLASPDNSDTRQQCWALPGKHTSEGLCIGAASAGAAAADARDTTSFTLAASVQDWRRYAEASVEDRSRRSYRLHSGGSGRGLETSRGGAGGGQESADIEGARSRSHGRAAERPELGLR